MKTRDKLIQLRRSELKNKTRGEAMREFRRKNKLTRDAAGVLCRCSGALIGMLEDRDEEVTHPKIAARIQEVFRLPEEMALTMLPKNYRPGPDYDPERYVFADPMSCDLAMIRLRIAERCAKRHGRG